MPLQSSVRALKKPLRLDDEVRFLRSWIEKPLHMGAVMPSGKILARTMAQYVDINSEGPVVELGPGTGAITSALIEHGVDQKRLVLVEYNPGFCALLRDRYPHAKVVQGDAYTLRDSLWDVLKVPASAVVSGLPLVTKPMLTRLKLIRDAFAALDQGVGDCTGPRPKFDDRPRGINIDVLRHGAGQHPSRRHHRAHVKRLFNP